ncbi:hypothetical protein CGLO_13335 [Colletotrichum gloeosporioides Cg-14]|uniref:Uncharacterized protein n=1 Tax=Colletotrichum gloeosporioides (strain Cg-14) TaxID=1237896 RepID=T0JWT6_COLGC|nr:hypothetical protein CGLO_13335 [Colletotrichum gloeosporioides Cg-14]
MTIIKPLKLSSLDTAYAG